MAENFNIQKVLVAPLDWGLGHATRCIPIIRGLMGNGYEVILAAEGAQAALFSKEFPQLACLPLQGYRVRYSKRRWQLPFTLLLQVPRLSAAIDRERRWLDAVIDTHKIDLVISDNRFGLSSKKVPCIFITHQLTIKTPFGWLEKMLRSVNYRYINQFTCCWVPDAPGEPNAAGVLSHPAKLPAVPVHYIGMLSRFQPAPAQPAYDYCILLSGPEPQRTILEEKIMAGIIGISGEILLVRGKPGSSETLQVPANVTVANHLPTADLQKAILQSEYIVCRGGYTSLMELLSIQKKLLLIPTPGQTEQEYLAKKLMIEGCCFSTTQDAFNCETHFSLARDFQYRMPVFPMFNENNIVDLLRAYSNA